MLRNFKGYIETKHKKNEFDEKLNEISSQFYEDQLQKYKKELINSVPLSCRVGESTSIHYDLLCKLKLNGFHPKRILEIGFFRGFTSIFLRLLYPNSEIYSIELPEKELIRNGSDAKGKGGLIDHQNSYSEKFGINLIRTNSVEIDSELGKFDLIWVDGNHSLPVAAIDVYNSIHLVGKNGIIMFDDFGFKELTFYKYQDDVADAYLALLPLFKKDTFLFKKTDEDVKFKDHPRMVAIYNAEKYLNLKKYLRLENDAKFNFITERQA